MSDQEREQIEYLIRGLYMYASQLREALKQNDSDLNLAVASRGDEVIEVMKQAQEILRKQD